jgi:hypothetical protein
MATAKAMVTAAEKATANTNFKFDINKKDRFVSGLSCLVVLLILLYEAFCFS